MTVENFVRIVRAVFEKTEKVQKWVFFSRRILVENVPNYYSG